MKNKILLISLLIASSSVLAEQGLLENAGQQVLQDAATSAAPKEAVEGVVAPGQALEKASEAKGVVETAPAVVKDQAADAATDAVKAKVDAATPAEVKQGAETLKKNKKSAKKVGGKIPKSTSEATEAVEGAAKEKAAGKALELVK